MATKRPTTFSMRMPEDLNEKLIAYAAAHDCTKAEAMSHFARAGIELEEGGSASVDGGAQDTSGTTASVEDSPSAETLAKIEERLEALQNLPTIEPSESAAIVPVDIRDKIQEYSNEHGCGEYDALTYYARLGIQLSGEARVATNSDMTELRGRLDALAQDSQSKGEQIAQMRQLLEEIRGYTKPEELEIEGEVADDAEDVEQHELTEEERQQLADERTRKIVSDVMEEYLGARDDEPEQDVQLDMRGYSVVNQWIPVLVAIIVSLIIGLVVVLTR